MKSTASNPPGHVDATDTAICQDQGASLTRIGRVTVMGSDKIHSYYPLFIVFTTHLYIYKYAVQMYTYLNLSVSYLYIFTTWVNNV